MNGGQDDGPFSMMCVYGEASKPGNTDYAQLVETPVICDGCKATIQMYLSDNCS